MLEKPVEEEHCDAMEGLLTEINEIINERGEKVVEDTALITAAQRVEHHEIAGYGAVGTYTDELGWGGAVSLLHETLEEEKAADKKLGEDSKGPLVQIESSRAKSLLRRGRFEVFFATFERGIEGALQASGGLLSELPTQVLHRIRSWGLNWRSLGTELEAGRSQFGSFLRASR